MTLPLANYREWRARADAHFAHHDDAPQWCTAQVLGMLRHSLAGERLWGEARDANFFEPRASAAS